MPTVTVVACADCCGGAPECVDSGTCDATASASLAACLGPGFDCSTCFTADVFITSQACCGGPVCTGGICRPQYTVNPATIVCVAGIICNVDGDFDSCGCFASVPPCPS